LQVLQNEEKKTVKSFWGDATLRGTHVGIMLQRIVEAGLFDEFARNEVPFIVGKRFLQNKGKEEPLHAYPRMLKTKPMAVKELML
jgi:hypothetical protein